MGRQGVSKGVSLFYEGMPIDYLNNDSSHDWINLQTKIYHFLTKFPLSEILEKFARKQNFLWHSWKFMKIWSLKFKIPTWKS